MFVASLLAETCVDESWDFVCKRVRIWCWCVFGVGLCYWFFKWLCFCFCLDGFTYYSVCGTYIGFGFKKQHAFDLKECVELKKANEECQRRFRNVSAADITKRAEWLVGYLTLDHVLLYL